MKNLRNYYVLAAIPPLFMLVGGIMFRDFVLHAIHINPVLNLFIIAVAVFGIALITLAFKLRSRFNNRPGATAARPVA